MKDVLQRLTEFIANHIIKALGIVVLTIVRLHPELFATPVHISLQAHCAGTRMFVVDNEVNQTLQLAWYVSALSRSYRNGVSLA